MSPADSEGEEDCGLKQTTLRDRVELDGIGVHSGAPVRLVLHPADAGSGICFLRTNLPGGRERLIPARREAVGATELCTVIGDGSGASVSTVEHLMAALIGLGVDNVLIEIDGPEVPILDGSSARFVESIDAVGLVEQSQRRKLLHILKTVRVENGRCWAELRPASRGCHLDVEIDFDNPVIGRQRATMEITPAVFRREISRARTFGFMRDVEFLWKKNLALGASLDNTVAIADDRVLNPEGLRFPNEFVRHKILDALGDLGLAGGAFQGSYRAYCAGHKLNFMMLQALFADRSAYTFEDAGAERRAAGHGEVLAAAAAFGPDRS
jgi:UDP-3-O-[3-hydroxymyristoyl] N-acetylglucosamine deacetylase